MILIVDDEAENRSSLAAVLEREGWSCLQAACGQEALALLREKPEIELLVTDLKMPGGLDGLELLQSARLVRPDVQRLLVTAFGTIEDTVSAMRAGAFDVLTKPLKSKNVRETVARLLARSPRAPSTSSVSPQAPATGASPSSSQLSQAFANVMQMLKRAAISQASVLFLGESGTGKSYLAKVLHQSSDRKAGPFIALNCASIPSELLESELFGYEKGAFTGAHQSREGKIMAANGGTLLLDEIGDLSSGLQAKLLQFIQDKKFFKLGSNREISADVRIVAATNRPLDELVKTGHFREDLLYRLRVVEITVPPLRERRTDLFWIIPALLDLLAEKNHLPPVRLTQGAFSALWKHEWPGNVRELENVLESALVLAPPEEIREGFVSEQALPAKFRALQGESVDLASIPDLATIERQTIQQTLLLTGGNRRLTASILGISERTLYRVLGSTPSPTVSQ